MFAPRRYYADVARHTTRVGLCMHICYACSSRADQAQKLSELQGVRALALFHSVTLQCMFYFLSIEERSSVKRTEEAIAVHEVATRRQAEFSGDGWLHGRRVQHTGMVVSGHLMRANSPQAASVGASVLTDLHSWIVLP